MNLNVHFHVAVPDGVFTSGQGTARADFCRLPTPDRLDVETLTVNVEMRVCHGSAATAFSLTIQASPPPTPPLARRSKHAFWARSASVSCLPCRADMALLTAVTIPCSRRPGPSGAEATLEVSTCTRGVVVSGTDRDGRERLLRYCARPPLSLERLSVLDDGRIAYAIRKPWGNETHRVMSPLQFLARLTALIPPPRHPLIRFYGVVRAALFFERESGSDPVALLPINETKTAAAPLTALELLQRRRRSRSHRIVNRPLCQSSLAGAVSKFRIAWLPSLPGTSRLPPFVTHRHVLTGPSS